MQGRLGGDKAEKKTDITPALKREIAELEKRKADLKNEIERAIAEVKAKLETEANKQIASLHVTYQSRLDGLDVEKRELAREREELRAIDARLIKQKQNLEIMITAIHKEKDELMALIKQNNTDYIANNQGIADDKQRINDRELEVIERKKILDQKESELAELEKTLQAEKASIDEAKTKSTLLKELEEVTKLRQELEIAKGNVAMLQDNVAQNISETNLLKLAAESEKNKAIENNQAATKAKEDLEKALEANKNIKASLIDLESRLTEKEQTLKEKEKFLTLREREIDTKISTLKKLREETK